MARLPRSIFVAPWSSVGGRSLVEAPAGGRAGSSGAAAYSGGRPPPADTRRVSPARALASPTRAEIYAHLQQAPDELTVREVAESFELHPNVARGHLQTLADAGLLTVGRRKHPGGGRPARVYRATGRTSHGAAATGGGPRRDLALLVGLLASVVDDESETGRPPANRAHEHATAEGRRLVGAHAATGEVGGLDGAGRTACQALATHLAEAEVAGSGDGWVDIAGVRGAFDLDGVRRELGDALERGLVAGALAAAGAPVTVDDPVDEPGVSRGGRPLWRARAVAATAVHSPVAPAGLVDARGRAREHGVVEAMRAITGLGLGEVLEVLTEGPGSPAAYARWADRAGHELLGVERAGDAATPAIRLLIRKGV
jgi:DNA-binding transcriptional ArsR family regulator/TusA-related sulfurtransferase